MSGRGNSGLLWVGGAVLAMVALRRPAAVAVTAVENYVADSRLNAILPVLQTASAQWGVPVSWLAAFAREESSFNPAAANVASSGDVARGGSWGLFAMTYTTAQGLGFTGPVPDASLVVGGHYFGSPDGLMDPATNADLAAHLLSGFIGRGYGIADAAALYNSGKTLARAPSSTRDTYVPNVVRFQQEYAALDAA